MQTGERPVLEAGRAGELVLAGDDLIDKILESGKGELTGQSGDRVVPGRLRRDRAGEVVRHGRAVADEPLRLGGGDEEPAGSEYPVGGLEVAPGVGQVVDHVDGQDQVEGLLGEVEFLGMADPQVQPGRLCHGHPQHPLRRVEPDTSRAGGLTDRGQMVRRSATHLQDGRVAIQTGVAHDVVNQSRICAPVSGVLDGQVVIVQGRC